MMAKTRLRLLWGEVLGLTSSGHPERRPSTLSVVTHLSADRLPQLHGLCKALVTANAPSNGGVISICAVILVEGEDAKSTRRAVRALPGVGQQLVVRVQCFTRRRSRRVFGHGSCQAPRWYPINQLRNKALAQAKTDLVLICDVDFRPCRRAASLAHMESEAVTLLKRASCRLNCIVLPAFEAVVRHDGNNADGNAVDSNMFDGIHKGSTGSARTVDEEESWWSETLGSKAGLLQQWGKGHVVPFASRVWTQGHRATEFTRWRRARTPYEVTYEEGFEPFVIMNRLLVPKFDERFEGYGRNKVIFFYRLHALGFSFTVEPGLFLVHAPHLPSDSWRRTFGRDAAVMPAGSHSERFTAILEQYELVKAEIGLEVAERRNPRQRRGWGKMLNKKTLGSWSAEGVARLGEFQCATQTLVRTDLMRHALFSSLHALWYEYQPRNVDTVTRFESRLARGDSDITIVTQCSLSRLGRLQHMCSLWTGVVSVAVIAERGGRVDRRMKRIAGALHNSVESGDKCRLDMCLCQFASSRVATDVLYPANALRNAAVAQAKTELIFLLDIDMMPMRGLHETFSSRPVYNRLVKTCTGGGRPIAAKSETSHIRDMAPGAPTFVVVPALEFADACLPDDPRIRALLDAGDKQTAADLVTSGDLQSFHAACFSEGHGQSNLDQWCSLPADAPPYEVVYGQGYEPYGVFSRKHAPSFDERFRGFGMDKVSFAWHLHRLGWTFQALPAAYLVDLPHPPTTHRKEYGAAPAFRASVDGLYQRFTAEVGRSAAVPAPSSSTGMVLTATNSDVVQPAPEDYELLAELSLLAWGDSWVAGARRSGLAGECGGGWELKGGVCAWQGLRAAGNDEADTASDTVVHEDYAVRPPRMVGGWTRVSVGEETVGSARGLRARSIIQPRTLHGVMRYWVCPRWDPESNQRGKLPGLGMSGDVRLFVRWRVGSLGYCSLMRLGQPLVDICKVHVILDRPFPLERGKTTSIQLEADMRRTPENGGSVLFRAWADGDVVYEARVYASGASVSAGELWVEEVLLHVISPENKEEGSGRDCVLIGGVEVWGRCPREETGGEIRNRHAKKGGGGDESVCVPDGPKDTLSPRENLRFVFVASTGRCGTHYLARLLGTAPEVLAFHEAGPNLSGHDTLLAAAHTPEESYPKRRHKADEILRSARQYLNNNNPCGEEGLRELTYVDTSHLFLKTFADVVMRELAPHFRVDVVVLRRDPAAVIKSRIELGHFCERHKHSDWFLLPRTFRHSGHHETGGVGIVCEPVRCQDPHAAELDGFEALIASIALNEANIRKFKSRYERRGGGGIASGRNIASEMPPTPRAPPAAEPPSAQRVGSASCNIINTSLESLRSEEGVRRLFADLDLEVQERTWDVVRAGETNTRSHEKRRVVPLEYCRERIERAGFDSQCSSSWA